MLSVDDLESLEETLEILSDAALMADLHEADDDVKSGRTLRLSRDDALERLGRQ